MTWILYLAPLFVAVVLHEVAHGYVAKLCGDTTAEKMGRLTLNPIPHIDPVGTLLLPGLLIASGAPILFGWAKPVPVVLRNLRNPKTDMAKVAAAGPAMNLLLAVVCAVVFHASADSAAEPTLVAVTAFVGVQVNIVLAVLNLVPILPLDGGRILVGLLPREPAIAMARLEPYGMMIVVALLATGVLGRVVGPVRDLLIQVLL